MNNDLEILKLIEQHHRSKACTGDAEAAAFADGIRVAATLIAPSVKIEWLPIVKEGTDLNATIDRYARMYSSLADLVTATLVRHSS